MSKNKNDNVQQAIAFLQDIDETLDESYSSLEEEIKALQVRVAIADKKADRRMRQKLRNNPNFIPNNRKKISIRNEILDEMEETCFIERVQEALRTAIPIALLIARLCASLIALLLSFEAVKRNISPEFLSKLMNFYSFCTSFKLA